MTEGDLPDASVRSPKDIVGHAHNAHRVFGDQAEWIEFPAAAQPINIVALLAFDAGTIDNNFAEGEVDCQLYAFPLLVEVIAGNTPETRVVDLAELRALDPEHHIADGLIVEVLIIVAALLAECSNVLQTIAFGHLDELGRWIRSNLL